MRQLLHRVQIIGSTIIALSLLGILLPNQAASQELDAKIGVSIRPVHSIIANLLDGLVEPQLILFSSQSAHHTALKPSQARIIAQSDVVIWMGIELETFLDKPIKIMAPNALSIRLLDIDGLDLNKRANGVIDPHIWLSIDNVNTLAQSISAQFIELYPEQRPRIKANLEAFNHRLKALSVEIDQAMHHQNGSNYLIYHDALKYLEKRYGFNAYAINSFDEEITPSAKRILEVGRMAKSGKYKCLFIEPNSHAASVVNAAKEAELPVKIVDPLGSEIEKGKDLYFDLMKNLANAIANCS